MKRNQLWAVRISSSLSLLGLRSDGVHSEQTNNRGRPETAPSGGLQRPPPCAPSEVVVAAPHHLRHRRHLVGVIQVRAAHGCRADITGSEAAPSTKAGGGGQGKRLTSASPRLRLTNPGGGLELWVVGPQRAPPTPGGCFGHQTILGQSLWRRGGVLYPNLQGGGVEKPCSPACPWCPPTGPSLKRSLANTQKFSKRIKASLAFIRG